MQLKGFDITAAPVPLTCLFRYPSRHLFANIGDKVLTLPGPTPTIGPSVQPPFGSNFAHAFPSDDKPLWNWQPPSFRKRGKWYRQRVSNLGTVCATLPDAESVFQDGLRILELHKENYGETGPKHLVLLWWEWPLEHQTTLRTGLSMNFLTPPPPGIKQNAMINAEEQATAIQFVDELISLGVLEPDSYPGNVVNTCPLFLVPKPGQPGQFRCIADMKKGGQNASVGADPVQMSSPADILPRLYS